MTRIGRRLVEDFLLPALNDERYGDLLKWVDRDKRYFSIRWSHKNAAKWTLADTAVFQDWDRLKGHYQPEMKGYYMQAKQRFRAALYKLNTVRKLPCDDKHVKKYQLILNPDKRHHEIMPRKSHSKYVQKEENQKCIRTSVICVHKSFKTEPNFEQSNISSCSPLSPSSSTKSEEGSHLVELEECLEEYQLAQEKQLKQGNTHNKHPRLTEDENSNCVSSILRERPQVNFVRKAPHVPIQPVPVYTKCNFRQAIEYSQRRFESPHMILAPTFNDPAGVKKELCNSSSSDGVLNLSIKCESETLSR